MPAKSYAPISPRVPFKSRLALDLFRAVYMDRAWMTEAHALDALILKLQDGLRYNMGLDVTLFGGNLGVQVGAHLRGDSIFHDVSIAVVVCDLAAPMRDGWSRFKVEILWIDPVTRTGKVLGSLEATDKDGFVGMYPAIPIINATIAEEVLRHFARVFARLQDAPRPSLGVLLPIWQDALHATGATLALSDECEDDVIVTAANRKKRVYIYQLREAPGTGAAHIPTGRYTVSLGDACNRDVDCFGVVEAVKRYILGARP